MKKLKPQKIKYMTGVALACTTMACTTWSQTSDPVLNILIKKGILTEAEAKQVSAEADAQKTSSSTKKPSPWVLPLGKETKLKLGGLIQGNAEFGDVSAWEGSFKTPGQVHDRFRLRRARINVSGEFLEHFDFKLEGDFQQGDGISDNRTGFSGTDLFVNYNQLPEANLRFGQYKAPFGLEQLTSDPTLFLAERSLPTLTLTPERQIGAEIRGKLLSRVLEGNKDLIEYSFGVFNGNGRNTTVNDDAQFMYVGRLSVTPFAGKLFDQPVKWRIGGNAMHSKYAEGTRIGQGGNLLENSDGSLSRFNAPDPAESTGWGVDQTLTIGPFDLIAEYLEQKVSPQADTGFSEFVANGYYGQASYYFPGRKFQVVGRYESFNPGQRDDDDIRSVVGGLNYYIKEDSLKLMFNYYHTWSDFRNEHRTLGEDEFDMGLVRLQLMF